MNTKLQKVTFYTCWTIIILLFSYRAYVSGQDEFGAFHWSLIDWSNSITTTCFVSIPLMPWIYWSKRQSGYQFNIFRGILLISCIFHIVFIFCFDIYLNPYSKDYTNNDAIITIWALSFILNYAFAVLFFIYKVTRTIVYRFHKKPLPSDSQQITEQK